MSGLSLNMGAFGSGSAALNGLPQAQTPAAAGASPQASTIGQKAFGIVTGSEGGPRTAGIALVSAGFLSLVGLWWIWYSLPR